MRSYCSQWPEFHPEFGLLCPSVRQRRMFRVATVCLMTIMVVGASRVLAAAHRPNAEEAYLASLGPDEDVSPELAVPPAAAEAGVPPRPQDPCAGLSRDDLAGYFLNPGCKFQGRHLQRKNDYRVATFVIGHIEPEHPVLSAYALRMAALEAPSKIADTNKKSGAEHPASAKKHKPKEGTQVELAHDSVRQGGSVASRQQGTPGNFSAYAADIKLNQHTGPFTDNRSAAANRSW